MSSGQVVRQAGNPAGETRRSRLTGRLRALLVRRNAAGGTPALTAWLLVGVAFAGMLASSAPAAGPDEPVHGATAWYLSANVLPPASPGAYSVPASIWVGKQGGQAGAVGPCYLGNAQQSANCLTPVKDETVTISTVLGYPPPYYWIAGAGERIAAGLFGNRYAAIGGRVASVLLNLGVLLLLCLYMRRRNAWFGNSLLLLATPTAVFLGATVNPSGWEIVCGLAMGVALFEAVWGRRPITAAAWPRATTAILVLASLGLSTARPLGCLWACGLVGSAVLLGRVTSRRACLRLAAAVAPGVILGLLWLVTHPVLSPPLLVGSSEAQPATVANLTRWGVQSLLLFPNRLFQMFGLLGWLDTPLPGLLVLAVGGGWAVLLSRLRVSRVALLCGVVGIVLVPSAIEAVGWRTWPEWWQGRYTLPFALPLMLLLLLRSSRPIPRTVSLVSAISVLSLGIMVWVNAARYAFGLSTVGLALTLSHPALGTDRIVLAVAAGAILVLAGGRLLWRALLLEPDGSQDLEPEAESEA